MTNLITEARELCEKATPGPWIRSKFGLNILTHDSEISTATQKYTGPSAYVADQMAVLDANAAFIARSRTLIPELCDALEKAEAHNAQLVRELSALARESVERDRALAKLEAEVEGWAKAKQEGRLVVLPLFCGQVVFCIENKRIFENMVKDILLNKDGPYRFTVIGDFYTPTLKSIASIGKTVFLTRAEAEAVLKEASRE